MRNNTKNTEQKTFTILRNDYSSFSFDAIHVIESDNVFHVSYEYTLHANTENALSERKDISFVHRLIFPNNPQKKANPDDLSSAIFYLGVAEMVNYWKVACPKVIEIKTGFLDDYQKLWFRNIFYNGLGEFMYLNNIVVSEEDFFEFIIPENIDVLAPISTVALSENILLPVGGGKDSIVTYELLQKAFSSQITLFAVNPIKATKRLFKRVKNIHKKDSIEVKRILDPKILECNKQGFLNGHVPFSALLGFTAVLTALLTDKKYILLSNESSANEENIVFEGMKINHQFSKSFEFENNFRTFIHKYIHKEIEYLSFLRPLSEIQIGKIFSHFPENFPIFKSCNVGSKKDVWCNACPKCLFAYIILFPFIPKEQIIQIFGKDLFADESLREYFHALVDKTKVKPFECVGTYAEVNLALQLSLYQYGIDKEKDVTVLPILLQEYVSMYFDNSLEKIEPKEYLERHSELSTIDTVHHNLHAISKLSSDFFENMREYL